ncbi:AMP-binding protein, partial [Agrococcus terreus]|uniref:AMP-binding protein n=1 Tax=Agrococcus terreus TaxID=574649 RepID=UPI003CD0B2F8
PAYRVHELEYVLNQAGVRLLVAAKEFKTSDYAGMIEVVRPNCGALDRVVLLDTPQWTELVESGDDVERSALSTAQAGLSADDPINIQYTSGTTGFPKGATLSHHNILNNGFFVGETNRYTDQDRICIPVPYYHCFGMVMGNLAATTHGATMVIPGPSFNPEQTLAAVEKYRCT